MINAFAELILYYLALFYLSALFTGKLNIDSIRNSTPNGGW